MSSGECGTLVVVVVVVAVGAEVMGGVRAPRRRLRGENWAKLGVARFGGRYIELALNFGASQQSDFLTRLRASVRPRGERERERETRRERDEERERL